MTAVAALLTGLGLLALALGGHALEDRLTGPELTGPEAEGRVAAFELGARVHAAAALGLSWMASGPGRPAAPALAAAGLVLFAGALCPTASPA